MILTGGKVRELELKHQREAALKSSRNAANVYLAQLLEGVFEHQVRILRAHLTAAAL
jgi:hypothetical protein